MIKDYYLQVESALLSNNFTIIILLLPLLYYNVGIGKIVNKQRILVTVELNLRVV